MRRSCVDLGTCCANAHMIFFLKLYMSLTENMHMCSSWTIRVDLRHRFIVVHMKEMNIFDQ